MERDVDDLREDFGRYLGSRFRQQPPPQRSVSVAVPDSVTPSPFLLGFERIEERAFSYPNIDDEISQIAGDSLLDISFASNAEVRGKPECLEQDYASHRGGSCFPQAHCPLDLSAGSPLRPRRKSHRSGKRRRDVTVGSRTSLPELELSDAEQKYKVPEKRPASGGIRENEGGKERSRTNAATSTDIPAIRIEEPKKDGVPSRTYSVDSVDSVPQVKFKRQVSQVPMLSRKFRSISEESPERSKISGVEETRKKDRQPRDPSVSVKFHIGEADSPSFVKREISATSEMDSSETPNLTDESHVKHRSHQKKKSHHHNRLHPEDAALLPRTRRGSHVRFDKYSERTTDKEAGLTPLQQENVNVHRFEYRAGSQAFSPESYLRGSGIMSSTKGGSKKDLKERKRKGVDRFIPPISLLPKPKKFDHNPHELFVEMDQLYFPGSAEGDWEWKETARWLKYEEDLEEGAQKWGKPHMSSLSFHSLLELRKCIENGSLLLDLEETDLRNIAEAMVDALVQSDQISLEHRSDILRILLARHEHVNEPRSRLRRQLTYNSLQTYFYRQQSGFSPNSLTVPHFSYDSTSPELKRLPSVSTHNGATLGLSNGHSSVYDLMKRKLTAPPYAIMKHIRPSSHSAVNVALPVEEESELERNLTTTTTLLDDMNKSDATGSRIFGRINFNAARERLGPIIRHHGVERNAEKYTPDIVKCLPEGAEAASVCVGGVEYLEKPAVVFVRLAHPQPMPRVTEVAVPVRFIFLLLGPLSANVDYHEVGRSIATLLANKRFHNAMYKSAVRQDVLHAINEFLDDSIVLPPGECDKKDLLKFEEIANKARFIHQRRKAMTAKAADVEKLRIEEAEKLKKDPLRRTKKCFGGLRREFTMRLQYYKSDFVDAFNMQCLTSVLLMFLACFVPAITFGAILSKKTGGILGVEETILATSLGGILFALFSAQPILLVGVNGTLLIFEQSLFNLCKANGFAFLSVRVWVSLWGAILCVITVAFEGSFLVRYVTRFSDDILNSLVSVIFVTEVIIFLAEIFTLHPVMQLKDYCEQNQTSSPYMKKQTDSGERNKLSLDFFHYSSSQLPNTALLSTILVIGTFILAYTFRSFRNSTYFSRKVRRVVGDFALSLAVVVMGLFDWSLNDELLTSKLYIQYNRLYLIVDPSNVKVWMPFALSIAGILFFLIIFVETEVGEMELAKKEHMLRKGSGYHWDLILTGVLCVLCSIFGLPWICALSVQSMGHLSSLTKYKRAPPGQKPPVSEVVEQRVTGVVLHIMIGSCLLFTALLNTIPVAVLFGVFLYFGVTNMKGVQMLSRSLLLFVPVKYHPSTVFCLRVQSCRMHLYTVIQLLCFAFVVTIKSIKMTAFAFPFTVMVTVIVRQKLLPFVFSDKELLALDGEENLTEHDGDSYEGRLPL